MSNRLSYSAINTYTTCGKKYDLRYNHKVKSKYLGGALAFGSAIDNALNTLLKTKDLQEARTSLENSWSSQYIDGGYKDLKEYINLVYAESDFDDELLTQEDKASLEQKALELHSYNWLDLFNTILKEKKEKGWTNLTFERKTFYNYANWLSMKQKGFIMVDSYAKQILPRIREVIEVQKKQTLTNEDGDSLVQYLDIILKWEDGRNILFDNKTSSREYEKDAALRSPQLISYYHSSKEEYTLQAVGFIVLSKHIHKNKEKYCKACGYNGTGGRHKTCNNDIDGKRCNGEWAILLKPECKIDVIINEVTETGENLVISTFDEANEGIKKGVFHKNLNACKNGPIVCDYYKLCWFNDDSDLNNEKKLD